MASLLDGQCRTGLPAIAAAAAATTTAAAAATRAAARLALLRLIHDQLAAVQFVVVEGFHRGATRVIVQLDEAEASRTTGFAVHDHMGVTHLSVLGEKCLQMFCFHLVWKISYVQSHF